MNKIKTSYEQKKLEQSKKPQWCRASGQLARSIEPSLEAYLIVIDKQGYFNCPLCGKRLLLKRHPKSPFKYYQVTRHKEA